MSQPLDPYTLRHLAGNLDLGHDLMADRARGAECDLHRFAFVHVAESYRTLAIGYRQKAIAAEQAAAKPEPEPERRTAVDRVSRALAVVVLAVLLILGLAVLAALLGLAWWGVTALWGWVL